MSDNRDFASQLDKLSLPWKQEDKSLVVNIKVKDFATALGKITQIGQAAEEINHHPDISLHGYNEITIITTTHDAGKLTDKDIQLARRIDAILT